MKEICKICKKEITGKMVCIPHLDVLKRYTCWECYKKKVGDE